MDNFMFMEQIRLLREAQDRALAEMQTILGTAQDRAEGEREFTEDEATRFDALNAECTERGDRIRALTEQEEREAAIAATTQRLGLGGAQVTSEPGPYTPESARNKGPSFFRDIWRASKGDPTAAERLHRNNAHREAYARSQGMSERAITTVNGAGGEFVPPLWLEQQFVPLARPGRAGANLCTMDALPEGTDSINIPKVVTGTAVAGQVNQNTAIQQTDITTTSVQSSVYTVAGGQTVSLQLIEQSPLNIDRVILMDLAKAYGIQIDQYAIAGTGTNQPLGLLNVAGINAITFTSAAPVLGGNDVTNSLYPKFANLIQQIQTSRYDVPTYWLMHPRRWYWMLAQSDSQNRPYVVPSDQGRFNNPLNGGAMNEVQGMVGTLMGIPVVIDPNVPINLGGGTNQDVIILAKFDDLYLWEGQVRAQAFEQTYANQLSLFIRLYNYMSFQGARYAKSIGTITGTGLATPTF